MGFEEFSCVTPLKQKENTHPHNDLKAAMTRKVNHYFWRLVISQHQSPIPRSTFNRNTFHIRNTCHTPCLILLPPALACPMDAGKNVHLKSLKLQTMAIHRHLQCPGSQVLSAIFLFLFINENQWQYLGEIPGMPGSHILVNSSRREPGTPCWASNSNIFTSFKQCQQLGHRVWEIEKFSPDRCGRCYSLVSLLLRLLGVVSSRFSTLLRCQLMLSSSLSFRCSLLVRNCHPPFLTFAPRWHSMPSLCCPAHKRHGETSPSEPVQQNRVSSVLQPWNMFQEFREWTSKKRCIGRQPQILWISSLIVDI